MGTQDNGLKQGVQVAEWLYRLMMGLAKLATVRSMGFGVDNLPVPFWAGGEGVSLPLADLPESERKAAEADILSGRTLVRAVKPMDTARKRAGVEGKRGRLLVAAWAADPHAIGRAVHAALLKLSLPEGAKATERAVKAFQAGYEPDGKGLTAETRAAIAGVVDALGPWPGARIVPGLRGVRKGTGLLFIGCTDESCPGFHGRRTKAKDRPNAPSGTLLGLKLETLAARYGRAFLTDAGELPPLEVDLTGAPVSVCDVWRRDMRPDAEPHERAAGRPCGSPTVVALDDRKRPAASLTSTQRASFGETVATPSVEEEADAPEEATALH